MCVCFCLGACVCAYLCVCGWVGVKERPALWFTQHSLCPAEILSFSGMIAFFFCPLRFLKYNFSGPGKPNGSHSHVLFPPVRKSEWLMLFFRKRHQRKTHEVKMSHAIVLFKGWTGFKNSEHSVWLLVKTLWALTKWKQKMLRSDLRKKNCILVCPQHTTAWVIYTYCTAAGVSWQSLSTCRRNEIQDVSPSTMNPS